MSSKGMRWAAFSIGIVLLGGCRARVVGERLKDLASADSALPCMATVKLAEPASAVLVAPRFSADQPDGFLVADPNSSRIYRFERGGSLDWSAGRRGKGPGEFVYPGAVVRAGSSLFVIDAFRGAMRWDGSGTAEQARADLRLVPTYSLMPLDDSTVLVAGKVRGAAESALLHFVDTRTLAVRGSFFHMPGSPVMRDVGRYMGFVSMAKHGDSIAVVAAMVDSVFFFTTSGVDLGSHPLRFATFQPVVTPRPNAPNASRQFREWLSSFDRVMSLAWTNDGRIVAQSSYVTDDGPVYTTVVMKGDSTAEWRRSPPLVSSIADTLVFLDPKREEPNALCLITAQYLSQTSQ